MIFVIIVNPADYVNGGELFTHLYQREKFTEDEVRIYIGEIIIAIEHLHRVSKTFYLDSFCPVFDKTCRILRLIRSPQLHWSEFTRDVNKNKQGPKLVTIIVYFYVHILQIWLFVWGIFIQESKHWTYTLWKLWQIAQCFSFCIILLHAIYLNSSLGRWPCKQLVDETN